MKKIFLGLLMLLCVAANAQTGQGNMKSVLYPTHTLDTVTNAGTRTQRVILAGPNDVVTIQVNITKISGTVAGSVVLQGSVDGVGYSNIGSAFTATNVASQTASFSINPSIYKYYQIAYTGTGTMAASFSSPYLYRNEK